MATLLVYADTYFFTYMYVQLETSWIINSMKGKDYLILVLVVVVHVVVDLDLVVRLV